MRYIRLSAVLLLAACGDGGTTPTSPPTPPPPVATSVTVSPNSVNLEGLGKTQQLTATVKDQFGATMSGASVSWSSSSATVTVSSSGLITAAAEGAAIITATSGTANGTAAVTVTLLVATVELDTTVLAFSAYGDTTQLTATAKDAAGTTISGASFTWSTSAASVATVSSTGLVTSVAAGTATITATSGTVSATASVTATDDQVPNVEWSTTSSSYDGELYGTVDVNVTTTDNYLIDSVSFFIDEVRYAYTGCGSAPKDSSIPITGSTATCDGTSAAFVFTWNSIESSGGARALKTTVYDQNGNSMTLTGSVTLMYQPSLKYVNLLYENVAVHTTTSGGVVLRTDTVAAQDSISGYKQVPSTDSTRVDFDVIRSLRTDGAPYGQQMGAYWSGASPNLAVRYEINNRMTIDNVTRYWYYPLWRNSSGITTVPFIDKTLLSEVNICWNSTQARFVCDIPSDSVLYATGYYLLTDSSDAAVARKVNSVSASSRYWHMESTGISSIMTLLSGAMEFHCATVVNSSGDSCSSWLTAATQQEAAEGVSTQSGMLAGDVPRPNPTQTMNVMIGGVEQTFLVNTDHLRVPEENNEDILKPPGTEDKILESVLDSSPITLPIVGEESQPRQR